MTSENTIKDALLRAAAILLAAIIVSTMPTSGICARAHTGSGGASSASVEAVTSAEIAEFMALLANPKIQKWLVEQHPAERDPAADRASPSKPQSGRAARAQTVRPVHLLALRHTFKSSG
jgi:hypothetical protein